MIVVGIGRCFTAFAARFGACFAGFKLSPNVRRVF